MVNTLVETYIGGRLDVTAGRVTTINLGASVLDVISDPERGNVTVNPDGTVALVLPDPGQQGDTSFAVRIAGPGGPRELTVALRATPGPEEDGWGTGDFYTLATNADDRTIVETGENHRKVYISGSKDALSIADIAAREGLKEKDIDSEWLAAHPEYGGSEGRALDVEAGMKLWYEVSGFRSAPTSNWLLFERGYEYEGTKRLIESGTVGEAGIHPVVIGAWGNGEKPIIADEWSFFQKLSKNIVIRDLDFADGGSIIGSAQNVIFEDVILRDGSTSIRGGEQITLRHSQILDVADHNKTNGLYVEKSEALLVENVLSDHNGWGRGIEPNAFNHNFYIQWSNLDVTFRDNVTLRGSSFGAQIRSGGVIENNAFLDNNIALNIKGGVSGNKYYGNYSLVIDNVVSSGAHKEAPKIGALAWGVQNLAHETSFIGNIIAHLADPANAKERAEKIHGTSDPLKHKFDPFVDDTIIYNWITDKGRDRNNSDRNVPDIAKAILNEVTLRRFIEGETGQKNPDDVIEALADWLRENWGEIDGAAEVVNFFQNGFGIDRDVRTKPADLRFVPDARGDGMRWDNRLNWSTEDQPINGDSVDLAGNWVTYSGTVRLDELELGEGGVLTVRQGYLGVNDLATGTGGRLEIGAAGQVWTQGYEGDETLTVAVDGGRLANTGAFTGPVDMKVSGGEVLLATSGAQFALDGTLRIVGDDAKIGFDGQGGKAASLVLMAGAELAFEAGSEGISAIREFRSGAWGTAGPNVVSQVNLGEGDTTLTLDLGALSKGTWETLVAVDQMTGGFGTIEIDGPATLRIDYEADRLEVLTRSSGKAELELVGSAEADVFVVADGIAATVEDYGRGDSIDLSAVLERGDLNGLLLKSAGSQMQLVDSDGTVLAQIEASGADSVAARADGWEMNVDTKGASGGRAVPNRPDPTVPEEPEVPTSPPANAKPVAADLRLEGETTSPVRGRVKAEDADGDALTYTLVKAPKVGEVTLNKNGRFTYDDEGAFDKVPVGQTKTQRFDFVASDGEGGSDRGQVTLVLEGTYRVPAPQPTPKPDWNEITGTAKSDVLNGTKGADLIRSGDGGYDRIWGKGGADAFVFGTETRDGTRASDTIFDFVARDMLVLEAGAQVRSIQDRGDSLWITLKGDSDLIVLDGTDLARDEVQILHSDGIWMG